MIIYVSHSRSFDFKKELYDVIRSAPFYKEHNFIFPHEQDGTMNSKDIIASCDIVLAEVSYPSTGQGIELGWADMLEKKIIAFHKTGLMPSSSVFTIVEEAIEYESAEECIKKIGEKIAIH